MPTWYRIYPGMGGSGSFIGFAHLDLGHDPPRGTVSARRAQFAMMADLVAGAQTAAPGVDDTASRLDPSLALRLGRLTGGNGRRLPKWRQWTRRRVNASEDGASTTWQLGSSTVPFTPMVSSVEDGEERRAGLLTNQDVFEWRARGYAHHELQIKELVDALNKELAVAENSPPAVTARDLRSINPIYIRRSTRPLLAVRGGAILFAVPDISISTIVLADRAFLISFQETVSAHLGSFSNKVLINTPQSHMADMIKRLESVRIAISVGAESSSFGYAALVTFVGESINKLSTRADRLAEKSKTLTITDQREPTLVAREEVRSGRIQLSQLQASAEGLESLLKEALESLAPELAAALATSDSTESQATLLDEVENMLEMQLHDLGCAMDTMRTIELNVELADHTFDTIETEERNRLIRFEVLTSATGVGLAFGGVISGIFGMNVSPGAQMWDENASGTNFDAIVASILFGSLVVTAIFVFLLYRVQTLRAIRQCCRRWKSKSNARVTDASSQYAEPLASHSHAPPKPGSIVQAPTLTSKHNDLPTHQLGRSEALSGGR